MLLLHVKDSVHTCSPPCWSEASGYHLRPSQVARQRPPRRETTPSFGHDLHLKDGESKEISGVVLGLRFDPSSVYVMEISS